MEGVWIAPVMAQVMMTLLLDLLADFAMMNRYGAPCCAGHPRRSAGRLNRRGGCFHSGPAYLPAVCGNMDLMILNFEISTVASMCRNMTASRSAFSTPKSSMVPLPP